MVERNQHFAQLPNSYLFKRISEKVHAFRNTHGDAYLINLGIGDTTIPLPQSLTEQLARFCTSLSTKEGYAGYQNEQGSYRLREKITSRFYANTPVDPSEVFISDGAKCDIGRLQLLCAHLTPVLIQNPTYPVYRDGTLLHGSQQIIYGSCTPQNNFFPVFEGTPKLIYLCSPNNPTGHAFSRDQLTQLIEYAQDVGALILFDAAYSSYIGDSSTPKSIFEIEGSRQCAIEVNSFSKSFGFTGIRLGWTVVPRELEFFYPDFSRLHGTLFNGASLLAQKAGEIALDEAYEESKNAIRAYKENTLCMRNALLEQGVRLYGGDSAPYLWVHVGNMTSWEAFDILLEESGIVCTPGSGFGSAGEHFIRLSGFYHPEQRERVLYALKECRLFQQEALPHTL